MGKGMRGFVVAVAGVAAMLSVAQAAPPPREVLAGSQIRRNVSLAPWTRHEVINLTPDGRFSGNFQSHRPTVRGGGDGRRGNLSGRWSIEQGQLCFEGSGLLHKGKNCYRLTKSGYSAREYSATHSRTGDVWQFFIYPSGG